MPTLTEREKYLMQQVWDHLQDEPMTPVMGSLDDWLAQTGDHGPEGDTITCCDFMAASAPAATEEDQQYWIFSGDMWRAGTDFRKACAQAIELSNRFGFGRNVENQKDAGRWIYLVGSTDVQCAELRPVMLAVSPRD